MLFQPRLIQVVFPVEGLDLLFTGDSFINGYFFFRLHFDTSGSASETNHVQGLVSGIDGAAEATGKGLAPKTI